MPSRSLRKLILKRTWLECKFSNRKNSQLWEKRDSAFKEHLLPHISSVIFDVFFPSGKVLCVLVITLQVLLRVVAIECSQLHYCFSVGHWVVLWITSGGSVDFSGECGGPEGTDPAGVIRSTWNGTADNSDDTELKVCSEHLCLWFWEAISYSAASYYSMY